VHFDSVRPFCLAENKKIPILKKILRICVALKPHKIMEELELEDLISSNEREESGYVVIPFNPEFDEDSLPFEEDSDDYRRSTGPDELFESPAEVRFLFFFSFFFFCLYALFPLAY
jgi:hypothetical protein